jgi:anti-anti-sigma regulatory factor
MELNGEKQHEAECLVEETLMVSGRATIQVAGELKERLCAALCANVAVILDVSTVTAADSSFIQLICSAHRTALASGRRLHLSAVRSEAFMQAATATGFAYAAISCREGDCIL